MDDAYEVSSCDKHCSVQKFTLRDVKLSCWQSGLLLYLSAFGLLVKREFVRNICLRSGILCINCAYKMSSFELHCSVNRIHFRDVEVELSYWQSGILLNLSAFGLLGKCNFVRNICLHSGILCIKGAYKLSSCDMHCSVNRIHFRDVELSYWQSGLLLYLSTFGLLRKWNSVETLT
jgi:hypothetical protein